MGQAGSIEQRNAIRDVLNLKSTEKEQALQALQAFCKVFPLEHGVVADVGKDNNSNVVELKEKKLFDVIHALLQQQTENTERHPNEDLIELLLTSFRRVIMWRDLYRLCARCSVKPFLNCMLLTPRLAYSVLEVVICMVTPCPGVEVNEKTERWETLNRRNFGDGGGYEVLRSLMVLHSADYNLSPEKETILSNVLQLFHLTLVSRRATTDAMTTIQAVTALLNARISLLELCHHSNSVIQELAIDLVRELFILIDLEQVHELQESAREYGALLYALSTAVANGKKPDGGKEGELTPTNSARALQDKCIDLVEMFCAGNTRSKKAMYRIFPVELFIPAESRADMISRHTASGTLKAARNQRSLPHFSFDFDFKNDNMESKRSRAGQSTSSRSGASGAFEKWLNDARHQGEHWRNVVDALLETHERPELVWRDPMRSELRSALRQEIEALEKRKRGGEFTAGSIARWDHEMFYVSYNSIQEELVVNGYFIEYLIPKIADLADSYEIVDPIVLAWHLSDRLAVEENTKWRLLCVRCLRLIIRRYAMIFHGQLPTRHVLEMLKSHDKYSIAFIRECFMLLSTAIATTRNAPSESLNRLSINVASAVIDVLSDSVLISKLSTYATTDPSHEPIDADEDEVQVRNVSDGLVRAGINVLHAIIRRARYILLLVRPKRAFMCRLLAVETLDHITTTRILAILKQLSLLDASGVLSNSFGPHSGKSSIELDWKSLALVYVLMASCDPKGMGMCQAAAEFLKENYTDPDQTASDIKVKSEINLLIKEAVGFGGCGMAPLLSSSTPESFVDIFNANEMRAADVLWGRKQRHRLFRYLKNKYVSASESNENQAEDSYDNEARIAEVESDLDDDVFVGNIFLRSYIEGNGQFLNVWTDEMYKTLVSGLFHRLLDLSRSKSTYGNLGRPPLLSQGSMANLPFEAWEIQVLILKALIRLIPGTCPSVEIKPDHYEALLIPLRRSLLGDTDQIRGILSMELLMGILSSSDGRNVNRATAVRFLAGNGLEVFADAFERMLNPTFQQLLVNRCQEDIHGNTARILLYRMTAVLNVLVAQEDGVQTIKKHHRIITGLIDLSSKQNIMKYSEDAAAVCLCALSRFCLNEELRAVFLELGGLLNLLEISAFCPIEEVESTSESADPADSQGEDDSRGDQPVIVHRKPSNFIAAVRAATIALRSCLEDTASSEPSSTYLVLKQLLTPSFVRILKNSPERFVVLLQSSEDVNTPTLIWTNSMRERLRDCLTMELLKVKTAASSDVWPRWDPDHFVAADSFRYQYPELSEELIVHDVYLNNFVSANGVYLDDIDMSSFSEALLISIQSNENVLRILHERGAADPDKEKAITVMRQALSKLVSEHPQHNLEVAAGPVAFHSLPSFGSDGDASLSIMDTPGQRGERLPSMDIEDLTV
ncbi:TPA: hypothetical protein N0F65_004468 [Lagenidium giganteum]|uniref:DnaJ homologue subfamily C GRV2/DNAJC13 N-terminal domain-containing protein n=1 Tax=Lagenidium giganteum TaxID=4803 RepID=A0AAV2ZFG5_9STRA|nr:TPA: hypothetical protein N0F65_004468 [Lagenidium giganteum]